MSTANIGRQNWKAIFNSGNAIVTAVASREAGRSREFIRKGQREFPFAAEPAALGSYEELLASPNVDAVLHPASDRTAQGMGPARGGGGQTRHL